jgi:hypothetical protein
MRRIVGLMIVVLLAGAVLPAFGGYWVSNDVARHKHVRTSSIYDGGDDSLCVDDDTTSCYHSNINAPMWMSVDLGADYIISLVRLIPYMAPEGPIQVQVLGTSTISGTWLIGSYTGTARTGQAINIPITSPIPVQVIQINVLSSCSKVSWYSIQCIKTDGSTGAHADSWGQLKARYR